MSQRCHCGSGMPLADCCGRFLSGALLPETAEELMRSRYTAYVLEDIAYLRDTFWPKHQPTFDEAAVAQRAQNNHWTGLKVLETSQGGPSDREGTVLFEARYLAGGELKTQRELSRFRKKAKRWYYVEALAERQGP